VRSVEILIDTGRLRRSVIVDINRVASFVILLSCRCRNVSTLQRIRLEYAWDDHLENVKVLSKGRGRGDEGDTELR